MTANATTIIPEPAPTLESTRDVSTSPQHLAAVLRERKTDKDAASVFGSHQHQLLIRRAKEASTDVLAADVTPADRLLQAAIEVVVPSETSLVHTIVCTFT